MPTLQDYQHSRYHRTWAEAANADNAVATATRAASPGNRHHIVSVDGAYSTSSTSGTLTVRSGTTVILQRRIHGAGAFDLGDSGVRALAANQAVSAELTASGTNGVIGFVTITGYTVAE